ncbi:MAG: hypothetical protein RJP96_02650 [Algiphilus sp.]|uniref:hypothetical protein n=1 Tax=Algiphilus sp. TaxID=1872431 RepID=UPI0032EFDDD6
MSGGSNPTKSLGEDLIGACVAAQMFMERRLRSPSTADFASCAPRAGETDVEVLTRSPYRYRVTSYVDAENAFGGIVREQFTAEVESGGGDWTLRSIQ